MNLNKLMSVRNHEGLLTLDHRASPGVADLPPGVGQGLFEAPTFTCTHCEGVVVINPDRKRERYHCMGCDHLICDGCAAIKVQTGVCRTFKQFVDEQMGQAARQASPTLVLP